jgi:lysyl-tRNA synthetase class 1
MTIAVPEAVSEVLSRFDTTQSPLGELEVADALRSAMNDLPAGDQSLRDGCFAESAAFRFTGNRRGKLSVWGTHFGPLGSGATDAGQPAYFPDVKDVDADIIAHWEKRSGEARHPVLRARYSDLVWDLKWHVMGDKPDPDFARRAISAYIETVERRLYNNQISGIRCSSYQSP